MTIGAKNVKTTKPYGKIARSRYNKRVKPVITSQAMLQNKGCHLEGCVHECSGVNFVVKLKQSLAEPIQIFVFHWPFVDFLMTFTQ